MQNFKPETLIVGTTFFEFDELPSTNTYAIEQLKASGLNEGALIFTHHQTKGRGQQGTVWESEKGVNVSASFVFKPTFVEPVEHFTLNKAVTLAVCDTVKSYLSSPDVYIKWPNDILVDDKKIAGILVENSIQGNKFNWSVVGIGLNVNQENFGVLARATSLTSILKQTVNLEEVLGRLCKFLEARYLQLKSGNIQLIEKDYIYHVFRLNEEHLYKANDKVFYGKILGIEPTGELIVQTDKEVKSFGFKQIEYIY